MKQVILICFLILVHLLPAQQTLVLNGNFINENIYIQNPKSDTGFCTQKVVVNETEIPFDKINSSAFEIDLISMGFKVGEAVKITIYHKNNCKPKVLNNGHHYPNNSNVILNLRIENDSLLKWESPLEKDGTFYSLQQYRWNKWINWEEINCIKNQDTITYSVNIKKYLHSEKNQFRICSKSNQKINCSTTIYTTQAKIEEPNFAFGGQYYKKNLVEIGKPSYWELYSSKGNLIKKGYGTNLSIAELKKGSYYLNYDNKTTEVTWY